MGIGRLQRDTCTWDCSSRHLGRRCFLACHRCRSLRCNFGNVFISHLALQLSSRSASVSNFATTAAKHCIKQSDNQSCRNYRYEDHRERCVELLHCNHQSLHCQTFTIKSLCYTWEWHKVRASLMLRIDCSKMLSLSFSIIYMNVY